MDTKEEIKRNSLTGMVSKEDGSVLNADDLKLAEMGYKPVYTGFGVRTDVRNYREDSHWCLPWLWALASQSILSGGLKANKSSWWGSSSTLIFAFGSGGPVLLIYGFMFMAIIAGAIAVSLGELASAYPNSGRVHE